MYSTFHLWEDRAQLSPAAVIRPYTQPNIDTTCAGMGREHCPYDSDHKYSSVLCEWEAKAATSWQEVKGLPLTRSFINRSTFKAQL